MSSQPSTPQPSPEAIDVDAAFDPEKRQAKAQMGVYEDNRPGINEAGVAVAPDGSVLEVPEGMSEDATQEEINKAATDAYFDEQRKTAKDHSQVSYEDMSIKALAHKLGEAEHFGDKTTEDSVTEVLLEKMGEEETKIAANEEGTETEARQDNLWDSVLAAKDLKKRQLKKQDGGDTKTPASENGDEPSDEPDNPNAPYDWDADGAFEPFVEEVVEEKPETGEAEHEGDVEPAGEGNEPPVFDHGPEADEELPAETGAHEAGMLVDIDPAPSKPEPQTQTSPEMPPPDEPSEDYESKEKGLRIEVGFAEEALKGEDAIVVNEEMGVFGVFDGLGGMGRGDEASKAAAEALENMYARRARENEYPQDVQTAIDDAKFVLAEARLKASQTGGHTTAVFAKLEKINGKDYLIWANAGDSRMIMQQADGRIVDISTDQSKGNMVLNDLGPTAEGPYKDRALRKLDEFGSIELQPDDRVMLCSDGITGDWDFQFLSREEFEDAFSKRTAQESAARFMELSRKDDDKSVIVIDAVVG